MSDDGPRRQPLTPGLLRMAGIMWILFFGASAFGSWAFLDSLNRDTTLAGVQLAIGLGGGFTFILFSRFARTPQRVAHWALLVGFLLAPPALSLFGVTGLGYFLFLDHPSPTGFVQGFALAVASVVWVGHDVQSFKRKLATSRFFDRELRDRDDRILMNWNRLTSFDEPGVSDSRNDRAPASSKGFAAKSIGLIVPLSIIGFSASRWLGNLGGAHLVLLVLTFLCLPIVLVILSKLACGAYLNIFLLRRLEVKSGKPVIFDQIPSE